MRISQKGIDLIKYFTECNLSSYYNTANVLAIGYGHTGKDVKRNMKITQEQAEAIHFTYVPSGVVELIARQEDGYAYIRA